MAANRVPEVAHFESCYHMIGSTESTLALPKVSPGYVRNASTKNISDRKIKESRLGVREFAISDISDFRHVDHCRASNSRFVEILNFRMLKIRISIGEVHFMPCY
tara:strand:+ start:185 stop:499 length:315 start_codon:yes stop_codon:yes gene_type:complete